MTSIAAAGSVAAGGGSVAAGGSSVAAGGSSLDRFSRADHLISGMAQQIEDGMVIATGVASYLAILAIALARATHAPRLTYLACVGSLDPAMDELQPSAESLSYLEGRRGEITIPDLFDHARRGRIDVMFFGAAEIDGYGDTNLTAAGSLERPTFKFPGVAGAATLRRWVHRPILSISRQSRRNLVPKVQVASTSDRKRQTPLYTDLGVFELGEGGAQLVARHPWTRREDIAERTGFDFRSADPLPVTPAPTAEAIEALQAFDKQGLRERLVG